jgi:hypothetical protein
MAALTQGNYPGDWLIEEFGAPHYCREEKILASGQDCVTGTVVANNSGTVSPFIHDDGTYGTPYGILLNDVDATGGAKACVVLVRGPAVVASGKLFYHADNDSAEVIIGNAALLALGIVGREGV